MKNPRTIIRDHLAQNGLTQKKFAEAVPVHECDMSRWLKMEPKMTPRRIYRARLSELVGADLNNADDWK